jgi:1,4-dihydroxy-2-naphthoyl-CoA hydrolase
MTKTTVDERGEPAFVHHLRVRLRDTDAAGVIYFANQLDMAHAAYEAWLYDAGVDFAALVTGPAASLPVVHAEIDFAGPLRVGDDVSIAVHVDRVGERSFTLAYVFTRGDGVRVGRAKMIHAGLDRVLGTSAPLPAAVRDVLERGRDGART